MAAHDEVQPESLQDEIANLIEEARMVLPGIQALFGFQMIAVFNEGFRRLDPTLQGAHLAAVLLVTLAIVLIMTPAAYHRIAERGEVSRRFSRLGSLLIASAMVPFAVGMSLDLMIITQLITESAAAAALSFCLALGVFLVAWFAFPLAAKRGRHRPKLRAR
jgi:hypothetical protein